MIMNREIFALFRPDLEDPQREDIVGSPWPLFLAFDEARYITGVTLPVDGGLLSKA